MLRIKTRGPSRAPERKHNAQGETGGRRGRANHLDAACPISTWRGTWRVRLVRGEGRGVST